MRPLLTLLVLSACARPTPSSPGVAETSDPRVAVDALIAAIEAQDVEAALATCSPAFRDRTSDSCGGFYEQAVAKGFTLPVVELREAEGRAVATLDVLRGGQRVDRVFLYLDREAGPWLATGLNEDQGMVAWFLAGAVTPDLRVEDLPSHPSLDALAAALEAGERPPGLGPGGEALDRLSAPTAVSTHWHEGVRRGAVHFTDADGEHLWLFLEDSEEGWRTLGHAYGTASTRALLRQD